MQMRGAPANGLSQDADDDDDDDDAGDSECVAQSLQSKLEDETVDRLMGILLAEKTDQLNGDDKRGQPEEETDVVKFRLGRRFLLRRLECSCCNNCFPCRREAPEA